MQNVDFDAQFLTGKRLFNLWRALSAHFNSNLDITKKGIPRLKDEAFAKRKDKRLFQTFKFDDERDFIAWFLVTLQKKMYSKTPYILDIVEIRANDKNAKNRWINKINNLKKFVKDDLSRLHIEHKCSLKDILSVPKDKSPDLFVLVLQNYINLETLLVLNHKFNIFDKWDKDFAHMIIWDKYKKYFKKYDKFINKDRVNLDKILDDVFILDKVA